MENSRSFKYYHLNRVELHVGRIYKVSWDHHGPNNTYMFVKASEKGYNFQNTQTGVYIRKRHIYPDNYRHNHFLLSPGFKVDDVKRGIEIFKIL